jgi:hypothetical protein
VLEQSYSVAVGRASTAAVRRRSHKAMWNAHVKDKLEDRLHGLVCAGKLPIEQAQREIATDWIAVYERYLGEP